MVLLYLHEGISPSLLALTKFVLSEAEDILLLLLELLLLIKLLLKRRMLPQAKIKKGAKIILNGLYSVNRQATAAAMKRNKKVLLLPIPLSQMNV